MSNQESVISVKQAAPFCVLIAVLLLLQTIGAYIGKDFLAWERIKGYWLLSRLVIPFFLILFLAIPLSKLYFAKPKFNKENNTFILFASLLLVGLFIYLQFFASDYLFHYRRGRSIEYFREIGYFFDFMLFTASTLIGWEVLHRGFLLGGGQYCLTEHFKVHPKAAAIIMVMIVCVFEVLFHIKKPIYEALGMLVASPLLSYLTIKTRSLWPALTFHLLIEVMFGFSAYYYTFS